MNILVSYCQQFNAGAFFYSFDVLTYHNFIECLTIIQFLCEQGLLATCQQQDLQRVVILCQNVPNHRQNPPCDAKIVAFTFQAQEILVFSKSMKNFDQTFLLDIIFIQVQLLQALVSGQNLGDLATTTIFEVVLLQIEATDVLVNFDRTCYVLEVVETHLDAHQFECFKRCILDQIVVNCHEMKLGKLNV